MFVTSGAGTLLVGGEMLNRMGSQGTGIAGGVRYPVGAGDVLHISARTPHGYLVTGPTLFNVTVGEQTVKGIASLAKTCCGAPQGFLGHLIAREFS